MLEAFTLHNRADQVIAAIEARNARLEADPRSQKYAALTEDPYRFFRGANHLFWVDHYHDWRFAAFGGVPGAMTWLQGDAHLYNLGAFSDDRGEVLFGLNDFDDAIVGDYQYDLWRFAVSLWIDAHEHHERKTRLKGIAELAEGYIETIAAPEYPTRFDADNTCKPLRGFLKKVADRKGRTAMLARWTQPDPKGRLRFDRNDPDLRPLGDQEAAPLEAAIRNYLARLDPSTRDRSILDLARRIGAGTGAFGLPRYYALLGGAAEGQTALILDIKLQPGPAALVAMSARERLAYARAFPQEGDRYTAGARALGQYADPWLGWLALPDGHYAVRERSPHKADLPDEALRDADDWLALARQWGVILASAHRRGAAALHSDAERFPATLARRLEARPDDFTRLLQEIAERYARCVRDDHEGFRDWLKDGHAPSE